eukprot:45464_1
MSSMNPLFKSSSSESSFKGNAPGSGSRFIADDGRTHFECTSSQSRQFTEKVISEHLSGEFQVSDTHIQGAESKNDSSTHEAEHSSETQERLRLRVRELEAQKLDDIRLLARIRELEDELANGDERIKRLRTAIQCYTSLALTTATVAGKNHLYGSVATVPEPQYVFPAEYQALLLQRSITEVSRSSCEESLEDSISFDETHEDFISNEK